MELLIRIKDKEQPDPKLASMASKAGDVIAVCPDGWKWTPAERENPEWQIIEVANLLPVEKDALLAAGMVGDQMKTRRARKIDTSLLKKLDPTKIETVTKASLIAAVVSKT